MAVRADPSDEIYGLAADEAIRTKVTLTHQDSFRARSLLELFRDRRGERTLEFAGVVELDARGVSVHDVEIDGDLVPGTYKLVVEVQTRAGKLTRSGVLVIRDPAATAGAR